MITVLRLGHRRGRDDRISSHVGLTARQFGADKIIFSGEHDENMLESQQDIVDRWGGEFEITYREAYRPVITEFEGTRVHLTMYGESFRESDVLEQDIDDLLIVVGSQKVPRDIYEKVDYNLGVGHQPHSEVAALAVFLYECNGHQIPQSFDGADIEVIPSEQHKKTRRPD
ncbi:MAG: tRNA (cytidine(56)-2'-O)-methyltransferase [Candidatus Nanohaloarchaeota archaeon QJJ-5]|nr:tRNA (cytidine(56)-2'-O)-methyltransferase [Candidatus Nanohaloarchaeota archaeon QJJ-5]